MCIGNSKGGLAKGEFNGDRTNILAILWRWQTSEGHWITEDQ